MTTTLNTPAPGKTLSFQATDVTDTKTLPVELDSSISADEAARIVAAMMALPNNVPWTLRENASCAFLDGDIAIGDQISTGAQVTVSPKAHLG